LRIERGSITGTAVDPDAPPAVRAAALAAASGGGDWATRVAGTITALRSQTRAVTSGSIDLPSLVQPEVIAKPRPSRLIDLLVTRQTVAGNAFEFFQQTVRTNNAAPVADSAVKPTSVFTVTPVEDRCRVIAHLTEPIPLRLLADHAALRVWLNSELVEGVLDALESQVIGGDGTGEHMTGILAAAGTTAVAYSADVVTTLRSALTALQQIGVQPNAWALSPADAQTVDLTRWSTTGGYLTDGYANTNAASANIFGDTSIQRVVSPSVPEGTAILGDWSKVGLWVREGVRIDIDAGGDLFTKNQAVLRGETRVGAGVLMPPAFAKIDLTA
jgi:HK97 family phage major capsid protein